MISIVLMIVDFLVVNAGTLARVVFEFVGEKPSCIAASTWKE